MTTRSMQRPDSVYVWATSDGPPDSAVSDAAGVFFTASTDLVFDEAPEGLAVRLSSPGGGVSRIALRWSHGVAEDALVLGDAWERSYGDLRWEHLRPERILPWYWIATVTGRETRGAGVRVRPGALCSWTVDIDGITLWLDVRSGSGAVFLGERSLHVATVVALAAPPETSAFDAQRELCAALCSDPLRSSGPLVGCNNWYYAYGNDFNAEAIVRDSAMISRVSGDHKVRPYCVIDAGWSEGGGAPGGPWDAGMGTFSDMASVAQHIRDEGARPGLWFRPLLTRIPDKLAHNVRLDGGWPLDPSLDETLERVSDDLQRFRDWGYELVKHDFSTFDVLGRFLPTADTELTTSPWTFADNTRTTAEVILALYRAIRDAAGDMVIIGCNTIGHLAAGLVHVQRVGDDTSGRQWERTRLMGVNALAFRLAQHNNFFTVDADCVASTPQTPWEKNSQFLDVVARSGTALFVSVEPSTLNSRVDADLRRAVTLALDGGQTGGVEPLDWQQTTAPRRWRTGSQEHQYNWSMPWGVDLSLASI
jgi:alpha-galactosidase